MILIWSNTWRPLTSVHILVEEMGQLATKTLIDHHGGHTLPLKISTLYIAERESCGKPPKVPKRKLLKLIKINENKRHAPKGACLLVNRVNAISTTKVLQ